MKVQTGQGTIPLITLIGIFSISALNALPGLAVSPILGDLNKIFPSATDLEIQMLSSLPSLLIIPFILLSGKLTEKVNNLLLLQIGLTIFGVSGILYLLSNKMWQLIAISAMLGIGSGLIVPLSTGLISRYFVGAYRTKQFGYSSAITNITLVLATTLTGYLAEVNWHLPFLVYLFPFISIFLTHYQFQPSFSDGRVRAFQWQGRNIDFLVFPCYHGAGLCAEQDSANVGASHLYGLFVDDSLWDGNYFAQPF